jgi:hypothetical protein
VPGSTERSKKFNRIAARFGKAKDTHTVEPPQAESFFIDPARFEFARRVNIGQLARALGLRPLRQVAFCPFCRNGKRVLWLSKNNKFCCDICDAQGDSLTLLSRVGKISLAAAALELTSEWDEQ